MVYAMASIGFLGFCVWSYLKMAFQYSNILVINITICWNSLNLGILLITFYSENINKRITQSAGNLAKYIIYNIFNMKGSSETTCDNTYNLNLFYNQYYKLFPNNKLNNDFLIWLIGFIEGDGSIFSSKNENRCFLIITQKDYNVLNLIKNTLLLGNVNYIYDNNKNIKFGRYVISSRKEIQLIYLLLNGNLHLKNKIEHLEKWYNIIKTYNINIPLIDKNIPNISINNSWLSGFTDAGGCFHISISKDKRDSNRIYVQSRFILDQKDEKDLLNEISLLLYNKQLAQLRNKTNKVYRIAISCNHHLKNQKVIDYFNKYPLKITKNKSFEIFKEILNIVILNKPLCNQDLDKVRLLKKDMNKFII